MDPFVDYIFIVIYELSYRRAIRFKPSAEINVRPLNGSQIITERVITKNNENLII